MEPADVELLYTWENDTSIWKVSNTLTPFSRFQLEEYVMNSRQDIFAARQLRLIIELRQPTPTAIGSIDLFDFDPVHLRAGIGILVHADYRQHGYARETMDILIVYAFSVLRLHQLYCHIAPGNEPSRRLFESLGFIHCGTKKDWINEDGVWQDEWTFQLINPNV